MKKEKQIKEIKEQMEQMIPEKQVISQEIPETKEKEDIEIGKQALKINRAEYKNGQIRLFVNKEVYTDENKRNKKYNDICIFLTVIGASRKEAKAIQKLGSPRSTKDLIGKEILVEVTENKENENYKRKATIII